MATFCGPSFRKSFTVPDSLSFTIVQSFEIVSLSSCKSSGSIEPFSFSSANSRSRMSLKLFDEKSLLVIGLMLVNRFVNTGEAVFEECFKKTLKGRLMNTQNSEERGGIHLYVDRFQVLGKNFMIKLSYKMTRTSISMLIRQLT
mmetsp:Transcript_13849/g.15389  ORF Transcript_13849/g.15389 Transcript_13849/m.15389 type:complete len:144 (+) Transcript_13849:455-886(+)